jgi:PAS domain S-box-containing protein
MVLVVANDPVYRLWNVGKEALGKPFLDIIPEMKDQPFMGWLLDVFYNGVTHYGNEEPAYFSRKNGLKETAYFNFVYQPYKEDDGSISGVMVLATDVTDQVNFRKKLEISEAHFRHMTDLMPVKITNAFADGSVFYYNQSWLDFTGKSFEELEEFGYEKIMHPEELEEFKERLKEAAESDSDVEMEMRFMNSDGEYIWHLNVASPVRDENGLLSMWIGVTTEIQKIKEEERLKNNFLSMASHELKTPVTTIKAYGQLAEVMLEQNGDIKTLSIVHKMTKQVNKLNQLISDLLDFTKIKKGKVIYHEAWFDFNDFAEEIIEDMQSTSATHTIEMAIGATAQVFGDKDKLGQVLNNLISNAIKYSPKAHNIVVSSILQDDGMKLCVKDSGIGISEEAQGKVFDAFYRVTGDKQSTFPGMGIGLFISTEIIKKFQGKLWLESTSHLGSKFSLTIPFDYRTHEGVV